MSAARRIDGNALMDADRRSLIAHLKGRPEELKKLELMGPGGQVDATKADKLEEVAGFCAVILRYLRQFMAGRERIEVLEGSCGKSYLGFALCMLIRDLENKDAGLVGVDSNPVLIDKCRALAGGLELDAEFVCCRMLDYRSERPCDLVVSLHACDTATDQVIAKGIQLEAELILTVPCCQNQIRGQIKDGHPLTAMTDFGPVRYRLANMLTDVLRAQFLRSAGYHVEMDEIGSPRLTPKNLCICARRVRRRSRTRRDEQYRMLRDLFHVRPKIETYCPGVVEAEGNSSCS
jgi:hypothetical protein